MRLTDAVSNLSPWLAPLPTAYVVYEAAAGVLGWPAWVAGVAAVIIETIGLATVHTGLQLFAYNRNKRKSDPDAPTWLAWTITAAVLIAQSVLIIVLEGRPVLLVFQVFSLAAVVNLALRADHDARLTTIADERAQRAQERAQMRAQPAITVSDPAQMLADFRAPAPQLTQGQTQAAQAAVVAAATLPHVCATCGAGYAKQTSLAAHMRKHRAQVTQ